ncbi:hypothetical protein [Limnobacter sp.]|uniref:hypothetical protein n=1 Tax=Limnobacter sp. TaxID=2003368 RepID=UPI0035153760
MPRTQPILLGLLGLLASGTALAQPLYANYYKQQYGYTPACMACHTDGGGSKLNTFGEQFKSAGSTPGSLTAIAGKDADGDGASNGDEATAKSNPGSKTSTPQNKGDWLDIASLIPKEIQRAFPGVKEYLPRDAFLTPQDIERAKGMGATLGKADDNTLYVALQDRKPVGVGIVFQAEYQGKPFFLLLTTDRQLNITQVAPLNTRQVKAASDPSLYNSYKGMALDKLPPGQGSDLQAAIAQAVKKAGTLVYVRLKNA